MPDEIQKFFVTNHGGYTCWPKVVKLGGSKHEWDGRFNDGGDRWRLDGTGKSTP